MQTSYQRAFTLIELLVVIGIVGVLSAVILTMLNDSRRDERDARRVADLTVLQGALDLYAHDHDGTYPPSVKEADISDVLTTLVPGYVTLLPDDPLPGDRHYWYKASPAQNPSSYCLGAQLEGVAPTTTSPCENSVALSRTVNYTVGKR